MEMIENRTFDEIRVGDSASLTRTLTREDIQLFAVMSGDVNPAHVDEEYAKSDVFHKIVAHGMWGGALISTLLGTKLPGPGTIYLGQTLRFTRPVGLGDTVTVVVTATGRDPATRRISFDCRCVNQNGDVVIEGTAEVRAQRWRSDFFGASTGAATALKLPRYSGPRSEPSCRGAACLAHRSTAATGTCRRPRPRPGLAICFGTS